MAAGSKRNISSPNYVHAGTQENTWRNAKNAALVGARNGKTQRGPRRRQQISMRRSAGTREAERQEYMKETRGHKSHLRDLEGVVPMWHRRSSLTRQLGGHR